MMDVLARALDGAGPIRSVPPSVVMRQWRDANDASPLAGRTDIKSAVQLGERTGASLVVLGSVMHSGADSIRGSIALVNVRTSRIVVEREARDELLHADRLADSLALAILRDIGVRAVRAVRAGGLGASSLPALKAFLRGEQLYRHGAVDSARLSYARAVDLDSGFALALYRVGWTGAWSGIGEVDSVIRARSYKAAALNRGLSPRDSLLIVLDSLRTSAETPRGYDRHLVPPEIAERMLGIAAELARRYDDAESLFHLGEIQTHFGASLSTSPSEMLSSFDRSIARDSSFAPAYDHVAGLAWYQGDTAAVRRYLRAMSVHASASELGRAVPILERALDGDAPSEAAFAATLDSLPLKTVLTAGSSTTVWMDALETNVRFFRYALQRVRREYPEALPSMRTAIARMLADRGHLREAYETYSRGGDEEAELYAQLAILRVVPERSAAETFGRWLAASDLLRASRANAWWAQRRDTLPLTHLIEGATKLKRGRDSLHIGAHVESSARLYLALARGDTNGALVVCSEMPARTAHLRLAEDVDCGRLLVAAGRVSDARRHLEPMMWQTGPIIRVARALVRGQAAERAGDRSAAATSYRQVLDAWRKPDSILAPAVAEARAGYDRVAARQ
jgi:serine/threonine-protein kinase